MNVKTTLLTGFLMIALVGLCWQSVQAQERANEKPRVSPNAAVSQTIGTTNVTITYGRPSVNGRQVFGGLEPYGEVWRTGANEATTITFSNDVLIEGEPLEAGTYGLFTVPGKEEWVVIFNDVPKQWGAFDYDSSEDVLRVQVDPEQAPNMEQLMFYFEDVTKESGTAVMHWADVKVPFTIEQAS